MQTLAVRHAVVTGSTSGIGLGIVEVLAAVDADLGQQVGGEGAG